MDARSSLGRTFHSTQKQLHKHNLHTEGFLDSNKSHKQDTAPHQANKTAMTLRKLTNQDMESMEYDSVSTITLVSGWDSGAESTLKFQCAVSTVMKNNPVLTGQLIKTSSAVQVNTGVFGIDDVFTVLAKKPCHNTFKVPVSEAEKLEALQKLLPEFSESVKSGNNLLRNKSNIFEVSLLLLPSGCACYKVSISHAIADASTYYRVMGQLSDVWNGK